MEKPSFKLIGAPCGQHGQYTFYKALRLTGTGEKDKIIAIGDFFFVKLWPDSQLVAIGELQLLWRDRVSEQTLLSLRLYCLPENTPLGRNRHGQDEVLAINDKVVIQADDLPSWLCSGDSWSCGLLAPYVGPDQATEGVMQSQPLHATKLDFSDVDKEKSSLPLEPSAPGVVVFSYGRYCRYRAILARLEGVQSQWVKDSLVIALGGYSAPTNNTRILYCKDTFEYPELEGHQFVCNHLAVRLKGRPRGRRRRPPHTHSPSDRSSDSGDSNTETKHIQPKTPRRLSLRNGTSDRSEEEQRSTTGAKETAADRAFLKRLSVYTHHSLTDLSLRMLYERVSSLGGYSEVCKQRLWKEVHSTQPAKARNIYERYLLSYENQERRNGKHFRSNGRTHSPIDTIDVPDSPSQIDHLDNTEEAETKQKTVTKRDEDTKNIPETNKKTLNERLKEEKPKHAENSETFQVKTHKTEPYVNRYNDETIDLSVKDTNIKIDNETGEINEELIKTSSKAEEYNKEFLESLQNDKDKPVLTLKPFSKLLDPNVKDNVVKLFEENNALVKELAEKHNQDTNKVIEEIESKKLSDGSSMFLNELAQRLSHGNTDVSLLDAAKPQDLVSLAKVNGHTDTSGSSGRPAGRSSLRAVRVKPVRPPLSNPNTPVPIRPDSSGASSSPPSASSSAPPVTNFGIHRPTQANSDDEIQEVPYKPKTPEIIDLDEYPESPQAFKKKKLDILKERGLEVTPLPPTPSTLPWGTVPPAVPLNPLITPAPILLNPAMQHQIMTQASLFQMYNVIPQKYNGIQPPKVIQATSIYGNTAPEKTVYGNPKDPFMPPPHILHGAPVKPRNFTPVTERPDILDLSKDKPAVEIVKLTPSSPKSSTSQTKNYTLVDGKAVVGSNLEITLVSPKSTPQKTQNRQPQKRSSNGKFMSTKTPPKESSSSSRPERSPKTSPSIKKPAINIPNYQIRDDPSPTSSTGSQSSSSQAQNSLLKSQLDLQKNAQNLAQSNIAQLLEMQKSLPMSPFTDPLYMNALYSSLGGTMDHRQLALYRDFMVTQLRYGQHANNN